MHDSTFRSRVQTFKERLLSSPDIISVTNSSGIPGRINNIKTMKIESEARMENQAVLYLLTDYNFIKTLGLNIVRGRDFDEKMGTDVHQAIIINQTAAKEFGWEDESIGKKVHYGFRQDGSGGKILKVIGVMEDFYFKSLHNAIEPVVLILSEQPQYFLACHIITENNKDAIEHLEKNWNEFNTKHPFDYEFLGNSFDDMYIADEKIGIIVRIATVLTIFIAILGLLGLSSFIAEQKTKEIGVRKVLGASVGNILLLLYREFALLILIAYAIAIPIAWWLLNSWLETNFTYCQNIQWASFLIAGLSAFFIWMATISFYIIKAALYNPSDTIKYE